MNRTLFLTVAAIVALGVGTMAIMFPSEFLASKGTLPSGAANLWMRETGLLIACIGIILLLVRSQPDSPTLKALMFGNFLVQLGLLATEIAGYGGGVITKVSGIVPNSILHVPLATGFAYFCLTIKVRR